MYDLSQLANMAEILGALFVIGGVFFAILQMRQIRQQRRELAAIELFRFFGSPEFSSAFHCILRLPDGVGKKEMREHHASAEPCAMVISTTMENIGVMVFHRIVPSVVVRNLVGTTAVTLWCKLEPWITDMREELGNPASFEWFEWLADMLERVEDGSSAPAYVEHKDWKPSHNRNEF